MLILSGAGERGNEKETVKKKDFTHSRCCAVMPESFPAYIPPKT